MGWVSLALIAIVVAGGIFLCLRLWKNYCATNTAADTAKDVFPVWAALGPFRNGPESAVAMRYAYLAASRDRKKIDDLALVFEQHALSFDTDPTAWEENRLVASKETGPKIIALIDEARRLRSLDEYVTALLEIETVDALKLFDMILPVTLDKLQNAYGKKLDELSVQGNRHAHTVADVVAAFERLKELAFLADHSGIIEYSKSREDRSL